MKKLYSIVIAVVAFAAISHFSAGSAKSQVGQPTPPSILEQLKTVQTLLNSIRSQLNGVQSHLDQLPPAWSQTIPTAERFVLVMGDAGVLDKETGLVWEQSPTTSQFPWSSTTPTTTAAAHCNNLTVGNRKGWRLPTLQELASLIDPSIAVPGPTLPAGHPFANVQSSFGVRDDLYWSATTSDFNTPFLASLVNFRNGTVVRGNSKTNMNFVWCVRGGQGVDPH